ncbi:MAG TPA: hypothetical protein VG204_16605 [Terriglobia bacterium]|nr:hypothetical protein [Terriglobia bacterium]
MLILKDFFGSFLNSCNFHPAPGVGSKHSSLAVFPKQPDSITDQKNREAYGYHRVETHEHCSGNTEEAEERDKAVVAAKNYDCQLSPLLENYAWISSLETVLLILKYFFGSFLEIFISAHLRPPSLSQEPSWAIQPHGLAVLGEADSGECSTAAAGKGAASAASPSSRADAWYPLLTQPARST